MFHYKQYNQSVVQVNYDSRLKQSKKQIGHPQHPICAFPITAEFC